MQVKLYAGIRQAAGVKNLEVEVKRETTVRDVLMDVTERYPVLVKFIWKTPGKLSEHAHVFVNSENILHLASLDTPVKMEDHVDIFPPLVGGSG